MPTFISRPAFYALLVAAFLACAGHGLWRSAILLNGLIHETADTVAAARDAHWQSQIDRANAVAAWNIIEQMRASQAAGLAAQATIDRLQDQVSELEAKNEGLPDRDGSGIDRARTRLLNNEPIANNPHRVSPQRDPARSTNALQ